MSVRVIFPEPPKEIPQCPTCKTEDPGQFGPIKGAGLRCACGGKIQAKRGQVPYVKAWAEALRTQHQLASWK